MSFLQNFLPRPNIAKLKDARDEKGLTKALSHRDPAIRWEAVFALRVITDPRYFDALVERFLASDPQGVLTVLGSIVVKHPDWRFRQQAVVLLPKLGKPEALDALLRALKDEYHEVRMFAALVLGGWPGEIPPWKDPRIVEALIAALADPHLDTRKAAATGLFRQGDLSMVAPLVRCLDSSLRTQDDAFSNLCTELGSILTKVRTPEAVDALIQVLGRASKWDIGSDPMLKGVGFPVERIAREGLKEMGEAAMDRIKAALEHDDPEMKAGAAAFLRMMPKRKR